MSEVTGLSLLFTLLKMFAHLYSVYQRMVIVAYMHSALAGIGFN